MPSDDELVSKLFGVREGFRNDAKLYNDLFYGNLAPLFQAFVEQVVLPR